MATRGRGNWAILTGLRLVLAWLLFDGHVWSYLADFSPDALWRGSWAGTAAVAGLLLVAGYLTISAIGGRLRLLPAYPLYLTAIVFSFGVDMALAARDDSCGVAAAPEKTGALMELGRALLGQIQGSKPIVLNGSIWPPAVADADLAGVVRSISHQGCAGLD